MGKGKLKNLFSSAKSTFRKISDKYNEMQEGNKPNSFEKAVNNLTDDIVIQKVPVEVNVPSWMKWLIIPAGVLLIWMMFKKNNPVRRKRRQAKKRSYSRQSSNYRRTSTNSRSSMRYQKRSPKRRIMRRR